MLSIKTIIILATTAAASGVYDPKDVYTVAETPMIQTPAPVTQDAATTTTTTTTTDIYTMPTPAPTTASGLDLTGVAPAPCPSLPQPPAPCPKLPQPDPPAPIAAEAPTPAPYDTADNISYKSAAGTIAPLYPLVATVLAIAVQFM